MNGPPCILCGKQADLLSTTNEWVYGCDHCNVRWNYDKEVLSTGNVWRDLEIAKKGFVVRN